LEVLYINNLRILFIFILLSFLLLILRCETTQNSETFNNVKYVDKNTKVGLNKQQNAYIFDSINKLELNELKKMIGVNNISINKSDNFSIAILDTGIYPHNDLTKPKNRIITFKDFVNDKPFSYDDNGHGTAIAGIIGGNGTMSNGKNLVLC